MIKAIICRGIGFSAGVKWVPTMGFNNGSMSGGAPVVVVATPYPMARRRGRR